MRRYSAVIAALVLSMVSMLGQPLSEINNYVFERTVLRPYKNLFTTTYDVSSQKRIDFDAGGGTISYFWGISSLSTNVTHTEVCETDENGYRRVRIEEIYNNRYAPDGRQTNLLDNSGGPYYLSPFDVWMIGTRVRTTEVNKIVDTGDFSIHYDNKNSLSPWAIRHYMSGNKGEYNTILRIGARAGGDFSPALDDAKKETGSSYSYAFFTGFDWWVPQDEPALVGGSTYTSITKYTTKKGFKYGRYSIQSPAALHWTFTPAGLDD